MNEGSRSILYGMQILIENQWQQDHAIVIEDHRIKAIIPSEMIKHHLPAHCDEFDKNGYAIPGLIDLHVHGAHGKDVMDASIDSLHIMSNALAAEGVTGFLATTMAAHNEHIEAALKTIAEAMPNKKGAAILGVHLEGPFLAHAKMGAQAEQARQDPNILTMQRWQEVANGAIKVVTLAPELPQAIALIQELNKMQVVASIGHTNATYEETTAAILAGCKQATHLFNAMRGLHQREPGAVGALLLSNVIIAEIIVDGVHLHPAIVELILKMKGKDNLMLITDAMRAKCLGDGEYELGGQRVDVIAHKAMLKDGTLAGSTLRMMDAIKNMIRFTKCTLADAIHMAAYVPAKALNLHASKGSIAVGKDADLVVINADLEVQMTMREGREMFRK